MLVAVYGTLRKGLGNYQRFLSDAKYMGSYETEPKYSLYNLGAFPGLQKEGTTAVTMEVFEIDLPLLEKLDHLEGYRIEAKALDNFYEREPITTPFGAAFTYFYYRSVLQVNRIKSGDWKEFTAEKHLQRNV